MFELFLKGDNMADPGPVPDPRAGALVLSDTKAMDVLASSRTVCKTRNIPVVRFKKI